MQRLDVQARKIDARALLKKPARESDCSVLISEPCVVYENGEPIIIYSRLPAVPDEILWSLRTMKFQTSTRTGGLVTTSRIFGFRPRNAIRNNFCSLTSFALEQPKQHNFIMNYGRELAREYRHLFPEHFAKQMEILHGKVLPEWTIAGTPFTSGIVNQNNPLGYHFDAGNFENVKSCMVVARKDIAGGLLTMPAYDLKFDLPDGAMILFDGQSILHGVTEIRKLAALAYRYSIVYYSLKDMGHCLPFNEELKFVRAARAERERKKAHE